MLAYEVSGWKCALVWHDLTRPDLFHPSFRPASDVGRAVYRLPAAASPPATAVQRPRGRRVRHDGARTVQAESQRLHRGGRLPDRVLLQPQLRGRHLQVGSSSAAR